MKQFDASVHEVHHISSNNLRIICDGCGKLNDARPGQFVMFRPHGWDVDPLLGRPLSILGTSENRAEFLVRIAGKGTRLLAKLSPGEEVSILGPIGTPFPAPQNGLLTILVAGGVGLPPLLMWAEKALEQGQSSTALVYGVCSGDDMVFAERLQALNDKGVEVVFTSEDGSCGKKGMVTDVLSEIIPQHGETSRVFTCGPEPMMKAVAEKCIDRDIPCWVSLENRMACGRGVCLGCARQNPDGDFFLVCEDGPVRRAEAVKWE